jgi:tRNA(Ile)-lysidine synthase
MAGPSREIAAVRVAVRRAFLLRRPEHRALVACSGGADSLALAAAARFVAPRLGVACGLVTVDHGLQAGSAERAVAMASWATSAGFDPALNVRADVTGRPGGPEAAAREARYEALCKAAHDCGATTVLLGHTLDDQAETVLLALSRGGGPRGLAGMPAARTVDGVTFLRPLLGLPRAVVRSAATDAGIEPWEDPHNVDPSYARARVRTALPLLTDALGPGLVANLARVAALAAQDNAALDEAAAAVAARARSGDGSLRLDVLAAQPDAIRTRVLRLFAAGIGANALSQRHIVALDALVTAWRGQGPVALPGGVHVGRRHGHLSRVGSVRG